MKNFLMILAIIIVVIVLLTTWDQAAECEQAGGTLVRTWGNWYECIEVKK